LHDKLNSTMTIENFIQQHQALFWSVSPEKRKDISETLLVETILNYGDLEAVKELLLILGLEKTATIFRASTENRTRHNYFPPVENFFRLYFNRHVAS
jgi:hypothetical protein